MADTVATTNVENGSASIVGDGGKPSNSSPTSSYPNIKSENESTYPDVMNGAAYGNTNGIANGSTKAPSTKVSKPRGSTKAQLMNKLYSMPAPVRTFPLPFFTPSNPLSLLQVIYTWVSQVFAPPSSHPETLYQGWFSPETLSVHVTDAKTIRVLWEQGFYGKGSLSRSEPSWLDREKRKRGAAADKTSEEVTRARRQERLRMKKERARKEREAIEQTLLKEQGLLSKSLAKSEVTSDVEATTQTAIEMEDLPETGCHIIAPIRPEVIRENILAKQTEVASDEAGPNNTSVPLEFGGGPLSEEVNSHPMQGSEAAKPVDLDMDGETIADVQELSMSPKVETQKISLSLEIIEPLVATQQASQREVIVPIECPANRLDDLSRILPETATIQIASTLSTSWAPPTDPAKLLLLPNTLPAPVGPDAIVTPHLTTSTSSDVGETPESVAINPFETKVWGPVPVLKSLRPPTGPAELLALPNSDNDLGRVTSTAGPEFLRSGLIDKRVVDLGSQTASGALCAGPVTTTPVTAIKIVRAPTGPAELLSLPNAASDLLACGSSAGFDTLNLDNIDLAQNISSVSAAVESFTSEECVLHRTYGTLEAPTGPMQLLILPNSTAEHRTLSVEFPGNNAEDEGYGSAPANPLSVAEAEATEVPTKSVTPWDVSAEYIAELPRSIEQEIQSESAAYEDDTSMTEIPIEACSSNVMNAQLEGITGERYVPLVDTSPTAPANEAMKIENIENHPTVSDVHSTVPDNCSDKSGISLAATSSGDISIDRKIEDLVNGLSEALKEPKSPKSVRFSPTVEKATFLHNAPPSPNALATSTEQDDEANNANRDQDSVTVTEKVHGTEQDFTILDQEHLQLSLEEAFFLNYGFGILRVLDPSSGTPVSTKKLFALCRSAADIHGEPTTRMPDDAFVLSYIVYHHFRSLGWVVRGGIKFGVDWLLYNRGPPFSHAEFAIMILPAYSNAYWSENAERRAYVQKKTDRSWSWLHCINRVNTQVKKTVILVYVDVPPPVGERMEEDLSMNEVLGRYKVREIVLKRWSANRNRD